MLRLGITAMNRTAMMALLLVVAGAHVAQGAITLYLDRSSWETAVAAAGLTQLNEDFTLFSDDDLDGAMRDFVVGPVSFMNNDLGFTEPSGFVSGGQLIGARDNSLFRSNNVDGPVFALGHTLRLCLT
jgi:hypothetical protein